MIKFALTIALSVAAFMLGCIAAWVSGRRGGWPYYAEVMGLWVLSGFMLLRSYRLARQFVEYRRATGDWP